MKKLSTLVLLFILIISYTNAQDFQWAVSEEASGAQSGEFLYIDESNNIYVGAKSLGDMFLISYNDVGANRFTLSSPGVEFFGMAAGEDDHISMVGYHYNGTHRDALLQVYGTSGTSIFTQTYDFMDENDMFRDAKVDAGGNIYVVGEATNLMEKYVTTIKYSASGSPQWIQEYGSILDKYRGFNIDINSSGEVFASGTVEKNATGTKQIFCIRYASDGSFIDIFEADIPGFTEWIPIFTILGEDNNLYVGGVAVNGSINKAFLMKIKDGNLLWSKTLPSPDNLSALNGGAFDEDGNIVVCGYWFEGDAAAYFAKISSTGGLLYQKTYSGPENGSSSFYDVVTKGEYSYFAGFTLGIGTNIDYAVLVTDKSGEMMWESRYNGFGNNLDVAHSIAIDNDNNVIISGTAVEQSGISCTTVKFGNSLGVADNENLESQSLEVYPNPALSTISFNLAPISKDAGYVITNIRGQLISEGLIQTGPTQQIDVSALSPGSYILKITDGKEQHYARFVKYSEFRFSFFSLPLCPADA